MRTKHMAKALGASRVMGLDELAIERLTLIRTCKQEIKRLKESEVLKQPPAAFTVNAPLAMLQVIYEAELKVWRRVLRLLEGKYKKEAQ